MKKKTFLIIGAILLIVAAVYYYFFPGLNPLEVAGIKKVGVPKDPGTVSQEDLTTKTADNGAFVTAASVMHDENGFPLMPGSRGEYVRELQKGLNRKYGSSLVEDGIYGPKTEKALSVNHFQNTVYYKQYYEILGIA